VLLDALSWGVAVGAYLILARHAFVERRTWIAVVGPLLALTGSFLLATLYLVRSEQRVRSFVRSVLGRYISPAVEREVTRNLALMGAERRQASVLVSDVEGFTAMAEKLSPDRVVQWISEYFTAMTAIVQEQEGHVDKYIGDTLVAFWGAPVRSDRHAALACDAALEMQQELFDRRAEWRSRYGNSLNCRIGVHTGDVVVGDMGAELKSNYTVLGEPVSLAGVLEGLNKSMGTAILVSERTVNEAGRAFVFRDVDLIRVSRLTEPVRIYELVGRADALSPGRSNQLAPFARALKAYRERRFEEAQTLFEECRRLEDPAADAYLERCRAYAAAPPGPLWDGVYERRGG